MKNKIIKTVLPMLFFAAGILPAQFNTLMPAQPVKQENRETQQASNEEKPVHKKEKKTWKSIFETTTKSELKNELDSLKSMLKEYRTVSEEKKLFHQQMKDSLGQLSTKKVIQHRQVPETRSQYELIQDPQDDLSKIAMPLRSKMTVTSPYGTRIHPIFGKTRMHNGIDLKASYENVYAVLDGIVTETGWDAKGGGNYIKVSHYNRFETSYLHLSETYYKEGEKVRAGFVIARSGNTGNSTGPHLHFAVREYGRSINPLYFLNDLIKANNLIANNYAN